MLIGQLKALIRLLLNKRIRAFLYQSAWKGVESIMVQEMDWFIRNEREAKLAAYAEDLAKQIEKTASLYDESGAFPFEHFDLLRKEGYFKLPIPKRYGGDEISLYEAVLIQERLAHGDGSTALAAGWHLGMFLNLRNAMKWKEGIFETLCQEAVQRGEPLNVFITERGKGNLLRGGQAGTIAQRTDGGYIITGRKSFATLSPILNHFTIFAFLEDEGITGEFLIQKTDQVRVIETWNTIGMRATGSHDVELDHVFVPEEALLSRIDKNGPKNNRATLLIIPSVYLGVAFAARNFILDYALSSYSHSLGGPISDAPHVRQKLGEIEALLKSSRILLYSLAAKWDEAPEQRLDLINDFHLAKYVVCSNAIQILNLAMKIAGGHSLSRDHKLERLFRDVQCGPHMAPTEDMVIHQLADAAITLVSKRGESRETVLTKQ